MIARHRARLLLPALLTVCGLAAARRSSGDLSASAAASAESTAGAVAPAMLEWKATKEEGVYGYLVYRATDRQGPYRRLGHEIVHVSQQPGEIHSYHFADAAVAAGRTYYYYLDKISTTGAKSRFSGVVAKRIPPV